MQLRKYLPEFIVLVYAVLFLLTKSPSNQWDRVIASDGKGYYAYLTALFIYHDTDYGYIDQYETEYYPPGRELFKDFRYDTGHGIVNKYFPGLAVLWLPFFAVGHAFASISGFPTDGYSLPYQMAIAFAAFFYFWLALLILRRILRFYTQNETAIAWSLVATALATNLIYHTVNAGCQVHVYNFFLINAFIYSVLAACKSGKPIYFIASAFMLGMVIISRPQNGIIVFALPFICGNREAFFLFFRRAFGQIRILLPSLLALLLPVLIPLTYWYAKTGHFLVYSYGSEAYDLTKPHLFLFLFSFEKGWLLYTPIAAFSALGFIYLFGKSKWQFYTLSAFLFFVVYFMSSWWAWNYTSYVGQRVMIDFYSFVAILLIYIFNWLANSRKRIMLPMIIIGFIALNLMQQFQHMIWVYPAGPPTLKTYFSNFFSFSKGTTFMIPENEIQSKKNYTTDFENENPLFKTDGLTFSSISHAGKNALILNSVSNGKQLFIRGMSDHKELHPVILKISGWYNPEVTDSSLTIDVCIGNYKGIYSTSHHNLMPGLKAGKWKYAEMAVYMPYIHSISDSLFISFHNLSKGNILLDGLQVGLLKMQGPGRHDWILAAEDHVDTATLYQTDLEAPLAAPWVNPSSVATTQYYSGKKSSCIQPQTPFSVVFEKELDSSSKTDGYFRVCSRILGDSLSEVLLVFDFSSKGKTVFYKTYPVKMSGINTIWTVSEIFRELPVARLKADKVKIYYWYLKGKTSCYIDDLQVDIVSYKTVERIRQTPFPGNINSETLVTTCCDFEKKCPPESGLTVEVPDAYSGNSVCLINANQLFSFTHQLPLNAIKNTKDVFVSISAKINSDHYKTGVTLVADFRHNGKSVSYHPDYLKGQTTKGQWNSIDFGVNIPDGITSNDSVLVYFYMPKSDEELMIDDFCVSLKKKRIKPLGK